MPRNLFLNGFALLFTVGLMVTLPKIDMFVIDFRQFSKVSIFITRVALLSLVGFFIQNMVLGDA